MFKVEVKTARFWYYCAGGWVRISLRDGQSYAWEQCGRTDEGWIASGVFFEREGHLVRVTESERGRDCDGYLSRSVTSVCHIADLSTVPSDDVWEYCTPDNLPTMSGGFRTPYKRAEDGCGYYVSTGQRPSRPKWENENSSQYDQFAESAGY